MKQLVSDQELIHYLDGNLSDQEIKTLQARLEEQGEPDLLYHLDLAQEKAMELQAEELFGTDNFEIGQDMLFQPTYAVAAKISSTFLEETDRNDKH